MDTLSTKFAALGDSTRFAIVERLLNEGELPASDLHSNFDMSPPAISRHLKVLREAKIVNCKVKAQQRLYSVRQESMAEISKWVMDHKEFWMGSMDRLDALIRKEINEENE